MSANKVYGYVRVSTKEQNEDRQLVALVPFKIPHSHIYMDKLSGKDFNRPAYKRLMSRLKPGDLLIIKSIDRLGRSYEDVIEQWRVITKEKRVDIKVIDMPLLDTTYCKDLLGTFISDLVLQVMSFAAQNEREMIRQRQAEGIAAALAKGTRWGNKVKPLPDNFEHVYAQWKKQKITVAEMARRCKMSRATFYKRLNEYNGDVTEQQC